MVRAPARALRCPSEVAARATCRPEASNLDEIELIFAVSPDEEYVHLSLRSSHGLVDLGARSHHYLLLSLARQRTRDANKGISESECGWVDLYDWAHDPTMAPPLLNLHVHRIRRQLIAQHVTLGFEIVERRVRQKKIRLHACRFRIHAL